MRGLLPFTTKSFLNIITSICSCRFNMQSLVQTLTSYFFGWWFTSTSICTRGFANCSSNISSSLPIIISWCSSYIRWSISRPTSILCVLLSFIKLVDKFIHLANVNLTSIVSVEDFEHRLILLFVKIKIISCHCL